LAIGRFRTFKMAVAVVQQSLALTAISKRFDAAEEYRLGRHGWGRLCSGPWRT
jgi:hypothetical protein